LGGISGKAFQTLKLIPPVQFEEFVSAGERKMRAWQTIRKLDASNSNLEGAISQQVNIFRHKKCPTKGEPR